MLKIIIVVVGLLYSQLGFAERLIPVEFIGQPVVLMEQGSPKSCGVRVSAVQTPLDINNPKELLWVPDGSFMFDRNAYGLVKAIAYQSSIQAFQTQSTPTEQPLAGFWFKADNYKATVPVTKIMKGEQKYSLIYVTDGSSVLGLYSAIIENKAIQFALKFKDSSDDIAFFGKVKLRPEETEQLVSCMNELALLMDDDLKSKGTK